MNLETAVINEIRNQIHRYFIAVYGEDYFYRPPESYRPLEQWLLVVISALLGNEVSLRQAKEIITSVEEEMGLLGVQKEKWLYTGKLVYVCECDREGHFDGSQHPYQGVLAGSCSALYVGRVCNLCAGDCMREYLLP